MDPAPPARPCSAHDSHAVSTPTTHLGTTSVSAHKDGVSMHTSSFAMSDVGEFKPLREQPSAQHLESLRLRKAYLATQGEVRVVNGAGSK
jgi:hypothetical protein